jgi:predicted phage tail protein
MGLTWTAPVSNGGSAITSYQISYTRPGAAAATVNTVGPVTSFNVTGLLQNTAYTFQVAARNAVGLGPSTAGVTRTTLTAAAAGTPGAPAIGRARQGASNGAITAFAAWAAPASNGGSPITGYVVQAYADNGVTTIGPPLTAGPAALTLEVTFANQNLVRFRVRAVNVVGQSAESGLSNSVVPR